MGATYLLRVGWRLLGHFAVLLTGIFTMESAVVEKPLAIETAESIAGARPMLPLLVLLFIGSGCSALIYEIVWLQLLQLVIGSTGRSMGVLLGTFMGGMCLGSLLLPRLISTRRHPLRVYAMLELGIGALGIAVLYGMPAIEGMYKGMIGHGIGARAIVGMICLLPPTLLMGATLPAIARWVESSPNGVSWMGFFYGGNIAGAVFGCLLAGFYLLRLYDMAHATYVAVAINVGVALAGLLIAGITKYRPTERPSRSRSPIAPRASGARYIYLAIGLSGLTGLGAEVVWTRLLALMLGQTVYTFSIILAVFLLGLGIGSAASSYVARYTTRPKVLLALCQLLLAGAVGWTAMAIAKSIPFWPIDVRMTTNASSAWGPLYLFQLDLVRVMWAVLPGAILWGASFPLALAAVSARGQDPGKLVGGVYAANTLGAIIGALAFAIILIPMEQIGTVGCERILVALCLLSALVVFVPMLWERRSEEDAAPLGAPELALGIVLVVIALFGGVYLISVIEPIPPVAVAWGRNSATDGASMGPGIIKESEVGAAILSHPNADRFCIYVGEGMNVSAAVTMSRTGYKYFHGAGKVQASTDPRDMRLQRMLGHISALTFTNHSPEKVLVVACGAGVTAGSFIPYDSVKREVICDIEPMVPQKVTPQFGPQNYHIVDNIANENPHMVDGKQVEVVYDDGRHFVRVTKEKFDVITSDPIDPWVKGCAALNTIEYYKMCRDHLNPGGVMALWIPLYESNLDTFKSVLETFFSVFPNGIVWSNDGGQGGYDAVLFGQMDPTRIDLDETDRWITAHPKVAKSLEDVGFGRPDAGGSNSYAVDLYSSYAGSAAGLVEWGKGAQINYDSNLRLQYLAGMSVNTYINDEILRSILSYYQYPAEMFSGSPRKLQELQEAFARTGRNARNPVAVQDSAR
ncbi:MAG TPA: hypothetical protein VH370_22225 [Humisphaera sp.]|nr:hypothetical protein [Humisphaera sp.]